MHLERRNYEHPYPKYFRFWEGYNKWKWTSVRHIVTCVFIGSLWLENADDDVLSNLLLLVLSSDAMKRTRIYSYNINMIKPLFPSLPFAVGTNYQIHVKTPWTTSNSWTCRHFSYKLCKISLQLHWRKCMNKL